VATLEEAQELQELITRCTGQNDAPALLEFVRLFHRVIAATVIKTARRFGPAGTEVIDDLIQDTYMRIFSGNCRILKEVRVEDKSRLFGFVQSVAFSVVQDHFRQQYAQKRGGRAPLVSMDAVERAGESGRGAKLCEQDLLLDKIDRLVQEVAPRETMKRDRLIFWLNHRSGFSAREIAELPSIGLSEKGVESVLHRLMSDLRAKILRMKQSAEKAPSKKGSA
jgi:RNA polymerase sigma factor (sigma-70 family)